MTVVLDSWAIIAWLNGEEPAMSRVEAVIAELPTVSWINLVEVYYRLQREHGDDVADATLAEIRRTIAADLPGTPRMIAAAKIKAKRPMALGDAFAIATAEAMIRGELWTGDPEILSQQGLGCELVDLRPPSA